MSDALLDQSSDLFNNCSTAVFQVLKPGFLTTLQDGGRTGWKRFGVTTSGAMDGFAFRLANRLVGNRDDAAGLEITLIGPVLQVLADCQVAVAGADLSLAVDGETIPLWESHPLKSGQILSFNKRRRGCRAYMSVAGGFDGHVVLGSCSTDLKMGLGGFHGRALSKGDVLHAIIAAHEGPVASLKRRVLPEVFLEYHQPFLLRVLPGPQRNLFSAESWHAFECGEFEVTPQSNRMGYRLRGPSIVADAREIISEPVCPGAIQVLPSGVLVLLMADHPTVGGYPKIAAVICADLPKAAQLSVGHRIRFKPVSLLEAEEALRLQQQHVARGIVVF